MKNTLGLLSTIAVIGGLMMAFMSCEVAQTITNSYDVYGKAVNTTKPTSDSFFSGLAGATVSLTDSSNSASAYYTNVSGSGSFSFSGIPNGKYIMSGSASTYTFIPLTVNITGANSVLPDLLAFPTVGDDTITIVMSWENTNYDMDLHMTWGSETNNNPNHLGRDYRDTNNNILVSQTLGTVTGTNWTATLERDVQASDITAGTPAVETISLKSMGSNMNETFRFYVNCSNTENGATGLSPTTAPAGVTVHVFAGSSHYGSFYAPYNTADTTLRMCRITTAPNSNNTATDFTVWADVQSTKLSATGMRSLNNLPIVGLPVSSLY